MNDPSSSRTRVRDIHSSTTRDALAGAFEDLDLTGLGWARAVRTIPPTLFDEHPGAHPARVVRVDRGGLLLVAAGGSPPLHVRDRTQEPTPAVVGDWVLVEPPALGAGGHGFARGRLPRRSVVARRRDTASTGPQALAANIDLVLVVESLAGRGTSPGRIARMAALAGAGGADVVVVLTHADLADAGAGDVPADLTDVVATSIVDGRGIDAVRRLLAHGITGTLLGASGAGKSSLLNALWGDEVQATAARRSSGTGRHATSAGRLVPLPSGGLLVDTPGVRGLGMHADVRLDALAPAGIDELAQRCRFRDCHHDGEPGCAVEAAIDRGELPADAIATWRKLQRETLRERARADNRLRRELAADDLARSRGYTRARRRGEVTQRRR